MHTNILLGLALADTPRELRCAYAHQLAEYLAAFHAILVEREAGRRATPAQEAALIEARTILDNAWGELGWYRHGEQLEQEFHDRPAAERLAIVEHLASTPHMLPVESVPYAHAC